MKLIINPEIYVIRPNIYTNSAETFISKSLNQGFLSLGLKSNIISSVDEIKRGSKEIFIIDDLCNYKSIEEAQKIKKFNKKGVIIALWVHWPILSSRCKHIWEDLLINHNQIFDIFFGEREEISMGQFSQVTKRKYYVIPNASPNEPLPLKKDFKRKNNYDIIFVGAKYKSKKFLFEKVIPLLKESHSNNMKIGLFGRGFNKRVRIANGITKIVNRTIDKINPKFSSYINKNVAEIGKVVSEGREPLMYKNSKICINFHEETPNHIIYNMRYFKIPYFGGFQIVDSPLKKSPYFVKQ